VISKATLDEGDLTNLESLYSFKFTAQERELLLNTGNGYLFSPRDQQRQYILRLALEPLQCPCCMRIVCQRSCGFETFNSEPKPDDSYECPLCDVKLQWGMELIGGGQFLLMLPGQTVTIGVGPVSSE
jgi:hypothetical protein